MAYSGPFKTMLSSVSLRGDFDTHRRTLSLGAVILWEPKLGKKLEHGRPQIVSATDSAGRSYAGESDTDYPSWQSTYRSFLSLEDGWNAVQLEDVSPTAVSLRAFAFELPVKVIQGTKSMRFKDVKSLTMPATRKGDDIEITLQSVDIGGRRAVVEVSLSDPHGTSWGSYSFELESGGNTMGDLSPRRISSSRGRQQMTLEGTLPPAAGPVGAMDFVITYPATSVQSKPLFRFESLPFPQGLPTHVAPATVLPQGFRIDDTETDLPMAHYVAARLLEQGRAEQALELYKEIEGEMAKQEDLDLAADYYLRYGAACEQAGQTDKAERIFSKGIEKCPDAHGILNYLAYQWAEEGKHLDQALVHARRAVDLEPLAGAYWDTLAWVLYKQGNIADAVEAIQKAKALLPDDPEVAAHHKAILAKQPK